MAQQNEHERRKPNPDVEALAKSVRELGKDMHEVGVATEKLSQRLLSVWTAEWCPPPNKVNTGR